MAEHKIELMLNGQRRSFSVETEETLLHVLREKAGLTGTKKGCDLGECGACTVIMNGCAVNSCCVFAVEADGGTVETIEGIGTPEHLHPLQQAFIDAGAIQCGFYAGHDHDGQGAAGQNAASHARGDPRGNVGQLVPLHRLYEDRAGNRRGIRGY